MAESESAAIQNLKGEEEVEIEVNSLQNDAIDEDQTNEHDEDQESEQDNGGDEAEDSTKQIIINGLHLLKPGESKKCKFWTHFMFFSPKHHPDKTDLVRCNLCGRELFTKFGRSTQALEGHLRLTHTDEYDILKGQDEVDEMARFEEIQNPYLVDADEKLKKRTKYSRCWKYFKFYDLTKHPKKVDMARCIMCGKDMSSKIGGQSLYMHLSKFHPEECKALYPGGEMPMHRYEKSKRLRGSVSFDPAACGGSDANVMPMRVRDEDSNSANGDVGMQYDGENSLAKEERRWMELWDNARSQLNKLRKEYKEEIDEDVRDDLKKDMMKLRKRKAYFEELLGLEP